MKMLLIGLLLLAASSAALKLAIPRRKAGLSATGSVLLDRMLPLTIVSCATIGLAMMLSAMGA